ncbi:uncharacterized protein Dere_GG13489 [Drosophila erecta]|uniref:Uncharacterized protein n=1 Tax=Drosophila erecta TaxID=7220 RepID=A0A0Q5U589_DROER|nr:uncharacterized protein Dere_GG13489 [Drosophila erecta]
MQPVAPRGPAAHCGVSASALAVPMPGSGIPRSSHTLQQGNQGSATPPWWSVIEILGRTKPGERPSRIGGKCLRCQSSDSIISSISNATGSGGESESSVASAQAQSAVYSGSAILCSVNSANNTRKLNLILSKSQQKRGEPFAVGTNLQNKLPASSADCHLSPSAETNIRTTTTADPPRSPSCPPCPYSHLHLHLHRHWHRHRQRPRHSQHHHRHYRHRGCRCRCRCRDASQSASASPASMVLPYQINQRATLLQQSATATATTAATTSTTLPHVPGAAATTNVSLRTVPRIFKRKRDTVQTATTASPLTPQQHPTAAAATSATSTTTTRRSRLEFILYTEVYQVEEDLVSPSDLNPQSNVGSDEPFWENYGK